MSSRLPHRPELASPHTLFAAATAEHFLARRSTNELDADFWFTLAGVIIGGLVLGVGIFLLSVHLFFREPSNKLPDAQGHGSQLNLTHPANSAPFDALPTNSSLSPSASCSSRPSIIANTAAPADIPLYIDPKAPYSHLIPSSNDNTDVGPIPLHTIQAIAPSSGIQPNSGLTSSSQPGFSADSASKEPQAGTSLAEAISSGRPRMRESMRHPTSPGLPAALVMASLHQCPIITFPPAAFAQVLDPSSRVVDAEPMPAQSPPSPAALADPLGLSVLSIHPSGPDIVPASVAANLYGSRFTPAVNSGAPPLPYHTQATPSVGEPGVDRFNFSFARDSADSNLLSSPRPSDSKQSHDESAHAALTEITTALDRERAWLPLDLHDPLAPTSLHPPSSFEPYPADAQIDGWLGHQNISEATAPQRVTASSPVGVHEELLVAKKDYNPAHDSEVSLKKGDVVRVACSIDERWVMVVKDQVPGRVPWECLGPIAS
ncbi:uncharacterized protein BJ171DRAFT_603741 [Polychytrium aggregatum]|uniref:uncharacterized protein n=1 Tax=Polychytrium aggregatum TaxID=110093 RepID=UPI0022FDBE40|nr:uncharacterized protein BJ171DRAFT_603741 [Polychytrium aggregatum]KAI9193364.1 hypothetical protein BJ171DRAFT_603741 [Polychytrium aggregatum]